jgi:hypothetical protein
LIFDQEGIMKLYDIAVSLVVGFSATAVSAESANSAPACSFWRGALVANAWPAQTEGIHSPRRDRTPPAAALDCFRCLHPLCSSRDSRAGR